MTSNTPPNSFFSMVTGISDRDLNTEGDEGNRLALDDFHTSGVI